MRVLILITGIYCQELEINNLQDKPIVIMKYKSCKIQSGNIKIIHPINITDLELTVNLITNIAYTRTENNNQLSKIMHYKIRELYSNMLQIRPSHTHRQKRWNTLGTTWKWIAGSPDADDLHIINSTMEQLISENNKQYHINDQMSTRIQQLTNTVNQLTSDNKIIRNEIDILSTIINIDTVNKILTDIQDTILLSKTLTANSKILSAKEIYTIKNLVQSQGVTVDIPDEAFNLVTPKISVNRDTLLYILQIPQLSNREATIIRILPLNLNDSIIKEYPTFLVKLHKTLFTTTHPASYVQRDEFIKKFSDTCISSLISGLHSKCIMMTETQTTAKLVTENTILITNAKNHKLISNCGPDNRTLLGNFLITFENCTVIFMEQQFTAKESYSKTEFLHGAIHNLVIEKEVQPEYNLAMIHKNTISNRDQLNHVYLQQYTNEIWNWGLLSGMSLSTIIIIGLIVLIIIKLKNIINSTARRILQKKKSKQQRTTPENTQDIINHSVEDDTSSPPGGVIPRPTCQTR